MKDKIDKLANKFQSISKSYLKAIDEINDMEDIFREKQKTAKEYDIKKIDEVIEIWEEKKYHLFGDYILLSSFDPNMLYQFTVISEDIFEEFDSLLDNFKNFLKQILNKIESTKILLEIM